MPRKDTPEDTALHKGLPGNPEAERMVLGSILLDEQVFPQAMAALGPDDFVLTAHQRIFRRMIEMRDANRAIEYTTLVDALEGKGQLEAVGGITYIASLTDSLPRLQNIDSYIGIVKEKSLRRRLITECQFIQSAALDESGDVGEVLAEAEGAVLRIGQSAVSGRTESVHDVVEGYPGGKAAFLDHRRRTRGLVGLPFLALQEFTSGLHPGQLVLLAARPGMGKTALAMRIAEGVAIPTEGQPSPVQFFSLEMSKSDLVGRLACSMARADHSKWMRGWTGREDLAKIEAAVDSLRSAPLYLEDQRSASTVMEIGARARRVQSEHGLALIVVDYLQLIGSRRVFRNRNDEVTAQSRELKLLAVDLGVPVLCLSQLNRDVEKRVGKKKPTLSDLRDSGALEQDADMVWFVYREGYYSRDDMGLQTDAEIIVAKQRNGPTGTAKVAWHGYCMRFENRPQDLGEDYGPPPDRSEEKYP